MIKVSDLWAEVKRIATERPDYVYPVDELGGCRYEADNAPSCIVGYALNRLGVEVGQLRDFDDGGGCYAENLPQFWPEIFEIDSESALRRVGAVQNAQDSEYPWGAAASYAEEVVQ